MCGDSCYIGAPSLYAIAVVVKYVVSRLRLQKRTAQMARRLFVLGYQESFLEVERPRRKKSRERALALFPFALSSLFAFALPPLSSIFYTADHQVNLILILLQIGSDQFPSRKSIEEPFSCYYVHILSLK